MTRDSGRHAQRGDVKWLPIAEYVGTYSVSSDGRVFSHLCDRELAPVLNSSGYATVKLRSRRHRIHRLVCEAFNGRGNALHRHVAHLNGDRADNRAENLKWVSPAENDSHKDRHGTRQAGAKHPRRKLTQEQVDEIRSSPETGAALARRFGVNKEAVSKVRLGQRWRCQSVIAQILSPSNHKDPSTMTTHKQSRILTLYRDDSTAQVRYERVKSYFFTANNTVLTISRYDADEGDAHHYIHWPRERFCWFKDQPQ